MIDIFFMSCLVCRKTKEIKVHEKKFVEYSGIVKTCDELDLGKGFRWRFLWMASRISSMRDLNACNALTISICFCPFLTGCNSQNAFDILSPAALEL